MMNGNGFIMPDTDTLIHVMNAIMIYIMDTLLYIYMMDTVIYLMETLIYIMDTQNDRLDSLIYTDYML